MVTLQQAQERIEQGDCLTARRILAAILRADRDNIDAWVLLSRCALNQYEYDRCKKEVLRRAPNHPAFEDLQTIIAKPDPIEESLASLGLMTQQMPAITAKEVQSASRTRRRRENPAYLNRFRVRVLRGVLFTGIGVTLLIAIVLLGVYLNDLAAENDLHATETRLAYNDAAATIYVENTLMVRTVAARATREAAMTQAVMTPQVSVITFARLGFRQASGIDRRTTFVPNEAISVEFGIQPGTNTTATLVLQVIDEAGTVVAEQSQAIGNLSLMTLAAPAGGWPVGNYTFQLIVNNTLNSQLPFNVAAVR